MWQAHDWFFRGSAAGTGNTTNGGHGQQDEDASQPSDSTCSNHIISSPCSSSKSQHNNHSYQSGTPAASDATSEPLDDTNDSSDGTSIGSSTHDVSPNDVLTTFSVFNIRGLKPRSTPSKVGTISDLLYDSSQLFMALSETWLSEHHDAEIHIQGYSLFRQDRTQTKGKRARNNGGVAVYVRDDAASNTEIIFTFSNGVIEALGIHIKTWNLAVVIVYRTPDDPKHNRKSAEKEFSQFLKAARDCLKKLPAPTPDIILCGDFNLPNADWNSGECRSGASRVREEQKMVSALYSFAVDNFLVQQIEQPTHRDGNILDFLFTNNRDLVHSYTSTYSGQSDHKVVEVRSHYKTEAPLEETSVKREPTGDNASFFDLNFFSDDIDWTGLNATLEDYNWSLDFKGLNPNDMFNKFLSICLSVETEYVPQRRRPRKSGCRIPRHRRVLMRTRRRINRQLTRTQSGPRRQALIKKLVKIENDLKESHRNQQEVQEQKAVNNIKKNSKYFFSYAKSLSKVKVGIGPLINSSKSLVSNARMMAEILSDHQELFPDTLPHNRDISDVLFTENELIEAMNDVSSNSAAGLDGFPAMFLKQCSRSLAHPLFMIWRHSLNTGTVPENVNLQTSSQYIRTRAVQNPRTTVQLLWHHSSSRHSRKLSDNTSSHTWRTTICSTHSNMGSEKEDHAWVSFLHTLIISHA